MSDILNAAAAIAGPTSAADATGIRGQWRVASIVGTISKTLGSGMPGKFLLVHATSQDVQISFSKGTQSLTFNQLADPNTGHVAAGATVEAGTWRDFPVPGDCDTINFVWQNTGGFVEGYCSQRLSRSK